MRLMAMIAGIFVQYSKNRSSDLIVTANAADFGD
jgi:hypothetical protein